MLAQFLIDCPECGRAGAAHVDEGGVTAVLVRFVCPGSCPTAPDTVLAGLSAAGGIAGLKPAA